MGGKLATAQAGPVKALPGSGPAGENIQMFSRVIARPGLVRRFKVGLNHIGHLAQHQRGPLLPRILHADVQRCRMFHGLSRILRRTLAVQLVTAYGIKADGIQDVQLVNYPAYGRLPVQRFKNAARR